MLGDLITLAGEAQIQKTGNPDLDVCKFVENALAGQNGNFSNSDLLADIDAVLLSDLLSNKSINKAFQEYYSGNTSNRAAIFVEKKHEGTYYLLEQRAVKYLLPNAMTVMFRAMFDSQYDSNIIDGVVDGFMNYLIMN